MLEPLRKMYCFLPCSRFSNTKDRAGPEVPRAVSGHATSGQTGRYVEPFCLPAGECLASTPREGGTCSFTPLPCLEPDPHPVASPQQSWPEEQHRASWWLHGKNPPASAGDTGLIPGPGRSHVLQSKMK